MTHYKIQQEEQNLFYCHRWWCCNNSNDLFKSISELRKAGTLHKYSVFPHECDTCQEDFLSYNLPTALLSFHIYNTIMYTNYYHVKEF